MTDSGKSPVAGLLDALFAIFGEAVSDIRHKVVETGWFGRQTTDTDPVSNIEINAPGETGMPSWYDDRRSFAERWGVHEHSAEREGRDRQEPAHDLGR